MNDRLTPERENEIREALAGDVIALLAELDDCRRDLAEERARTTRLTEARDAVDREYAHARELLERLTPAVGIARLKLRRGDPAAASAALDKACDEMDAITDRHLVAFAAAHTECGAGTEQPA